MDGSQLSSNIDESRSRIFAVHSTNIIVFSSEQSMASSSLVEGLKNLTTDERSSQSEAGFNAGSLFNSLIPIVATQSSRIRDRLTRYRAFKPVGSTKTTSKPSELPHHLNVLDSQFVHPGNPNARGC